MSVRLETGDCPDAGLKTAKRPLVHWSGTYLQAAEESGSAVSNFPKRCTVHSFVVDTLLPQKPVRLLVHEMLFKPNA